MITSLRPVPTHILATGIAAFMVQLFLIRRYYYLSRMPIVTIILIALALGAFGGAFSTGMMTIFAAFVPRGGFAAPVTIWFTLSAATDCFIAFALVFQLHRMKSGFKSSESLVRRLTFTAIQTGMAPSVFAILTLAFYLHRTLNGHLATIFSFSLSCMYTLTMLHNLNRRKWLSGLSTTDGISSFRGEPGSLGLNLTGLKMTATTESSMPTVPA
jgi:hypothetical protein